MPMPDPHDWPFADDLGAGADDERPAWAPRPGAGADLRPPRPEIRRQADRVGGAFGIEGLPVFAVTDYGALVGEDDTGAIMDAVADAIAADGGIIYFPAGDYVIGGGAAPQVLVEDAHCLTFLGEGDCTILRREGTDPDAGIFLFVRCTDIVMRSLALDANGFEPPFDSEQRALAQFEACERVRIEDVYAFDSNVAPIDDVDPDVINHRYDTAHHVAVGFYSDGPEDLRDLLVQRCRLETLGIAVHGASRVRIQDNTVTEARGHGIAVGARASTQTNRDIDIVGNAVADAWAFGIVAADIAPTGSQIVSTRMERVRIQGNRVTKTRRTYERGIVVGLLDEVDLEPGSARPADYGQITVTGNVVVLSAPAEELRSDIFLEFGERAKVGGIWLEVPLQEGQPFMRTFRRSQVTSNQVSGARSGESQDLAQDRLGRGIQATHLAECEIGGNVIEDSDRGVELEGIVFRTHVHDNSVEATVHAYRFGQSLGSNTFNGNADLVPPRDGELAIAREAVWGHDEVSWTDRFLGGDGRGGVVGLEGAFLFEEILEAFGLR